MKIPEETQRIRFSKTIRACIENGERLLEDARWWLADERSPTITALCILAQEEFAKAFLLYLVCEGVIPWTAKVRESLHSHKHKQLIGLIMEGLSSSNDAFFDRMTIEPRDHKSLPPHITDAMKLYVEKVRPRTHISCPPAVSDQIAKSIARGDRDRIKQDALYVGLSDDGDVLSVPSAITHDMAAEELEKTKRLKDLVRPLREDVRPIIVDHELFLETMRFLLLDKTTRPVLFMKDSRFSGPVTSADGTTWMHCIEVCVENISYEEATSVGGYATLYLNSELVKPMFRFEKLTMAPGATNRCSFHISEETYACAISNSHKLKLYVDLEYQGIGASSKYRAHLWSMHDSDTGIFSERFSDSEESLSDRS